MVDAVNTVRLVAALGCGAVGGVFFAFSTFVMRGLGRLPAAHGSAAMQAINVTAVSPLFMISLFGTAGACLAAAASSAQRWGEPGSSAALAAQAAGFLQVGNLRP